MNPSAKDDPTNRKSKENERRRDDEEASAKSSADQQDGDRSSEGQDASSPKLQSRPSKDVSSSKDSTKTDKQQTPYGKLRSILSKVHVVDILPERSTVCTFDAAVPIYEILSSLLAFCHRTQEAWQSENPGAVEPGTTLPNMAEAVAPCLSSNVLAEVCEFSSSGKDKGSSPRSDSRQRTAKSGSGSGQTPSARGRVGQDRAQAEVIDEGRDNDAGSEPVHRSWTGADDGWGQESPNSPVKVTSEPEPPALKDDTSDTLNEKTSTRNEIEGETMNWLQMPFTVQELSEFLVFSFTEDPAVLDWDLSRWRQHKETTSRHLSARGKSVRHGSLFTELPAFNTPPNPDGPPGLQTTPSSTLMQMIHGSSAPPRPMLRIEDPESTFLRAVELLLAHPELSALPVVSMVQRNVVAHLTLSQCLALLVQHFRGENIAPLAKITFPDEPLKILHWQDEKESEKLATKGGIPKNACICMDADKDCLFDLLEFFSKTNFTAVPIITDGCILVGVLGRRNLLQMLDLSMESCVRIYAQQAQGIEEIPFDCTWTCRQIIETLKKYTPPHNSSFFGAKDTNEPLDMNVMLCEILLADNHKVVLIEPQGENKMLRRMYHVDEVIQTVLYGDGELPESLRNE